MILLATTFVLVAALLIAQPYLSKRTLLFGTAIPEQFIQHAKVRALRKRYSFTMFGLICIITILFFIFSPQEQSFFLAVTAIIIASFLLYYQYHRRAQQLVDDEQFYAGLEEIRVTDTSVRARSHTTPTLLFLLPMIVTIAIAILTFQYYDTIPSKIPIHWGIDGSADSWVDKSWLAAMGLPIVMLGIQVLMLIVALGSQQTKVQLNANQSAEAASFEVKKRRASTYFSLILSYALTTMFSYLQFTELIRPQASHARWPFIALLVIIIGGTLWLTIYTARQQTTTAATSTKTALRDDHYWRGGVFYINRHDPALFISKRTNIGWTLNFGNPWAYCLLLIIFIPLLWALLVT